MIKNISALGSSIHVSTGSTTYPYISNNTPLSGMMRYNSINQAVEVTDGTAWYNISNQSTISLSPEVEDLLKWVRQYRAEIEAEKKLRENNIAVKKAWEQYQVVKTLSEKTENV